MGSSSVITVVELDQKNVNKGKNKEKWTVNVPIIRTTPAAKPSDDDEEERKRWSVNIPIIREPEKKQDEKSKESEREKEDSIKVVEVKEEKHLAIAQDDNETQEKSAEINIAKPEEPAFVSERIKWESSSVSHKVTGSSMTKIHSPSIQTAVVNSTQDINPLLNTENTYSTVAHQVCDVTEKPSESQSVINTSKTEEESSSFTHKVSQFDPDLRTSIVAHQVNDTVVKTDLPVNPICKQEEEEIESAAKHIIGGM